MSKKKFKQFFSLSKLYFFKSKWVTPVCVGLIIGIATQRIPELKAYTDLITNQVIDLINRYSSTLLIE